MAYPHDEDIRALFSPSEIDPTARNFTINSRCIDLTTWKTLQRLLLTEIDADMAVRKIFQDYKPAHGHMPWEHSAFDTVITVIRKFGRYERVSKMIAEVLNEVHALQSSQPEGLPETDDFVSLFIVEVDDIGNVVDMWGGKDEQPWDEDWRQFIEPYTNAAAFAAIYQTRKAVDRYDRLAVSEPKRAFWNSLEVEADTEERRLGLWLFMSGAEQWLKFAGSWCFERCLQGDASTPLPTYEVPSTGLWHFTNKTTWTGRDGWTTDRWSHWEARTADIASMQEADMRLQELADRVNKLLKSARSQ